MHTSTTEEINTVLLHPAYHAVEAAALGTVRFPRDYTA